MHLYGCTLPYHVWLNFESGRGGKKKRKRQTLVHNSLGDGCSGQEGGLKNKTGKYQRQKTESAGKVFGL